MQQQNRHFRRWPISDLDDIVIREIRDSGLHAGFPSPATDYEQHRINLTKELVRHPDYTEIIEVHGDCCIDAGILDPCKVLVDYSEHASHGDLVYIRLGDEDMIRMYCFEDRKIVLRTANKNKNYEPIYFEKEENLSIRGVVVHILIDPRKINRR